MFYAFENMGLYSCVELISHTMSYPLSNASSYMHKYLSTTDDNQHTKQMLASFELLERLTKKYDKPEFGITHTKVNGSIVELSEEYVMEKDFCKLLHFKKLSKTKEIQEQKKMLLVAPISGHYATLLRNTVKSLLPHFDVYITDWVNASQVPLSKGKFDLEDCVEYIIAFIKRFKQPCNVMAICQATVPVLSAVSILSEEKDDRAPANMILIGGPIDARRSPTEVNMFAENKKMDWFESHVVTRVPVNHPGYMRSVYPGFLQLSGFLSMNMQRHIGEHVKLFNHLVIGDDDSAEAHKKFYNEYLSVCDMPAEFYLQTVDAVFKRYLLPTGQLYVNNKKVSPSAIEKTRLLVLEGELDDISGLGQTKAAIGLCKNLADKDKHYHMQKNVGHYGIFNGSKFTKFVVPVIKDWIDS